MGNLGEGEQVLSRKTQETATVGILKNRTVGVYMGDQPWLQLSIPPG